MPISLNNHETRITALENSTSSGSGVSTNIGAGRVNLKIASDLSTFTALITASNGSEVPLISIVTGSNSNGYMVVKDIYNDKTFSIRLGTDSDRNIYLTKDDNKAYRVSITPLGGYSGNITCSIATSLPAYYIKFTPWIYDQRTTTTGTSTTSIGTLYVSEAQTTSNTLVLEYSGNVSSNLDKLYIFCMNSGGKSYVHLGVNGQALAKIHKKITVTRKVNGGSAITDTYTFDSDGRLALTSGSALSFIGIARGAVVEFTISTT